MNNYLKNYSAGKLLFCFDVFKKINSRISISCDLCPPHAGCLPEEGSAVRCRGIFWAQGCSGRPWAWTPSWAQAQQGPGGCRCAHAMLTCSQAISCCWSSSQPWASGCLHAWLSAWTLHANSLAFLFQRKVLGCLNSPAVMLPSRGDSVDNLKLSTPFPLTAKMVLILHLFGTLTDSTLVSQ